MYSYKYDAETGGLLLDNTPLEFSKEPRPVYYEELDILGFDKFWKYEKNDVYPYMWAEANRYYYRGREVAKTKGGSIAIAPEIVIEDEPEPLGQPLKYVDIPAMIEKNRYILESLVQDTIKKVYNIYINYKDKADVFYVAFSGGKDSVSMLDIVQRALPHNAFKVLFGDTGMEFPDTYKTVDVIENECREKNIEFIRAKAKYKPEDTWNLFGPPATVTRWCCSVHKTAPQILELRKLVNKQNFTGVAFIGVRRSESVSRSEYEYISLGKKHKGQYSCNPILEWNSAELYIYMYTNALYINPAYKKGNRRAGCLVCPRAAERNEYMAHQCYQKEFEKFTGIIEKLYASSFDSKQELDDFILHGGWKARKNGRDLSINIGYSEKKTENKQILTIKGPKTDWKTWIKTIGVLLNDESPYRVLFRNREYTFELLENTKGYEVSISNTIAKEAPIFIRLLKNVFRKAACCIGCQVCVADCHNGCLSIENNKVSISNNCIHCAECHKVSKGCLIYKSLEIPKGGLLMSKNMSLNSYSHHAPKMDWFKQFFEYKDEFDEKHSLGSQMYSFFKRFLRDANLLDDGKFSDTAKIIDKLGLDNLSGWGIMLVNLSYTPQINWYVNRLNFGETYNKEYVLNLLVDDGAKESWVKDIWASFRRFAELPFNKVGLGYADKEKNKVVAITRNPWTNPDPLVVLYGLYKFAEECGNYYQFTLARLMDSNIESEGVSPVRIFGIEREQMKKILNGLSINYPDYINASFTLDLDNISLREDKKSTDILALF